MEPIFIESDEQQQEPRQPQTPSKKRKRQQEQVIVIDDSEQEESEDQEETEWVPEDDWNERRMEWGLSSGERFDGYTDFLKVYPPPPDIFIAPREFKSDMTEQEYIRQTEHYEHQLPRVYNQWRKNLDPMLEKTLPYPKTIYYGYTPDWGWRSFTLPPVRAVQPPPVRAVQPPPVRAVQPPPVRAPPSTMWTPTLPVKGPARAPEPPVWTPTLPVRAPKPTQAPLVRAPEAPRVRATELPSRPDALVDACDYYYNHKLSAAEIKAGRLAVSQAWLTADRRRQSDLTQNLNEKDLSDLFDFYDQIFFANAFRKLFTLKQFGFRVMPSTTLTKTAGLCAYDPSKKKHNCIYWIELAVNVFRQTFTNGAYAHTLNGLVCRNRLECLQLTLEHEMIHLLMYLWTACNIGSRRKSGIGGHGPSFKKLALNIFGHLETRHSLFTGLSQTQAGEYKPRAENLRTTRATLREGMTITRTDNGVKYQIMKLTPNGFTARNATGSGFKASYLWKGYTIDAAPSGPSAGPAAMGASDPAEAIKARMRPGKYISIKGENYEIVKLNQVKFRVQHMVTGKMMDIPYLWSGYTFTP